MKPGIPIYHFDKESGMYILDRNYTYFSKRYSKYVYLVAGFKSDGATDAIDIPSAGWWVHDKLCDTGKWADGTKCTNWQASSVLSDILASEGRWIRSKSWLISTWLFGGGEARKNGMW